MSENAEVRPGVETVVASEGALAKRAAEEKTKKEEKSGVSSLWRALCCCVTGGKSRRKSGYRAPTQPLLCSVPRSAPRKHTLVLDLDEVRLAFFVVSYLTISRR